VPALSPAILVAFLGGVLPSLLWLAFWLFEDRCEPEPKRYIFFTFVVGMVSVYPVLLCEQLAVSYISPGVLLGAAASPLLLLTWAGTEEVFKFMAAYLTSLRSWVFDEPIDAVIYMVTAALGFSAVENALFLFGALPQGVIHGVLTEDLRFVGATLLHTLSSATIGVALALSFYKSTSMRWLYTLCGLILATALHTLFNFFILGSSGAATFFIFLCIWFGIIAVLLLVERVKSPSRDYC
jgi:RsiW-degrading membrane proteinase PrsW (M82 family)